MSDISVSASVTRNELSLGDLDLNDGVNYQLAKNFSAGSVTWRKQTVESPFYEGRYVVHEVKDAAETRLTVYVFGASYPALNSNLETLLAAFTEQSSYDVIITTEGQEHRWTCERADYEVAFATETVNALFVPVTFTMMRTPTPVSGAF